MSSSLSSRYLFRLRKVAVYFSSGNRAVILPRAMSTASIKPDMKLTHKLLDDFSTQKYYVEYQGSFSNHVTQGIIAMVTLGANEATVRSYVDKYVQKLESPENFSNDLDPEIAVGEDFVELIGRRKGFAQLREYYGKKADNEELSSVVASCLPGLCTGMIGSAAHGLIYLGYAFAAQKRTTVVEGLAYLHYANMPLETRQDLTDPKLGRGPQGILEVLQAVKESHLEKWMLRKVQQAPWDTFNTGFQRKAAVLVTCKADELLQFVYQIKFPEELHQDSVHARATAIGNWLVDVALTAYTIAEHKNDFFLLHGVTLAWSLKQLLPCLESHAELTKATTAFLSVLVTVYVVQGCQVLSPQELQVDVELASWESIIQRTLQPEKEDEHVYKLVQVCYQMSQERGKEDDDAASRLYKQAAECALGNVLMF